MTKDESAALIRAAVICKQYGHERLSDELYGVLGLTTQDSHDRKRLGSVPAPPSDAVHERSPGSSASPSSRH